MKEHLKGIIKENTSNINWKAILISMISLVAIGYVVKKNKKSVIPLSLLASSGCAQASLPYAFKPIGFSDNEVQQLEDAANEWNDKSNGKYAAIVFPNCDETCSTVESVPYIEEQPKAIASCLGYKSIGGIEVSDSCSNGSDFDKYRLQFGRNLNYNLRRTALHELGHVFGKKDSNTPGTIMYFDDSDPNQPDHLTVEDLK